VLTVGIEDSKEEYKQAGTNYIMVDDAPIVDDSSP